MQTTLLSASSSAGARRAGTPSRASSASSSVGAARGRSRSTESGSIRSSKTRRARLPATGSPTRSTTSSSPGTSSASATPPTRIKTPAARLATRRPVDTRPTVAADESIRRPQLSRVTAAPAPRWGLHPEAPSPPASFGTPPLKLVPLARAVARTGRKAARALDATSVFKTGEVWQHARRNPAWLRRFRPVSKPGRSGSPKLGTFDSCAAPSPND